MYHQIMAIDFHIKNFILLKLDIFSCYGSGQGDVVIYEENIEKGINAIILFSMIAVIIIAVRALGIVKIMFLSTFGANTLR